MLYIELESIDYKIIAVAHAISFDEPVAKGRNIAWYLLGRLSCWYLVPEAHRAIYSVQATEEEAKVGRETQSPFVFDIGNLPIVEPTQPSRPLLPGSQRWVYRPRGFRAFAEPVEEIFVERRRYGVFHLKRFFQCFLTGRTKNPPPATLLWHGDGGDST